MTSRPEMWLAFADAHYPHIHRPTWKAFLNFASRNRIAGVVDLGDTVDNSCISRHTKGKPGLRTPSAYKLDTQGYFEEIVGPLEKAIGPKARKVRILGNHCDWEREYYEENPELTGVLDRCGELKERGWEIVPFGTHFRYGKLTYIHGELLSGKYHAAKALELFGRNLLYAHFHAPQTMTKVLSSDQTQKFQATCAPIVGEINPAWMENRSSAWVNGFCVICYHGNGNFNLYSVVVSKGVCVFGSELYGA